MLLRIEERNEHFDKVKPNRKLPDLGDEEAFVQLLDCSGTTPDKMYSNEIATPILDSRAVS
jgi:hypothetical protein